MERNNEVHCNHKEAMTLWEEARKAAQAAKTCFTLKKPVPGVIEKGTKRPMGSKHAEVASDGEQNDEDDDDNN